MLGKIIIRERKKKKQDIRSNRLDIVEPSIMRGEIRSINQEWYSLPYTHPSATLLPLNNPAVQIDKSLTRDVWCVLWLRTIDLS